MFLLIQIFYIYFLETISCCIIILINSNYDIVFKYLNFISKILQHLCLNSWTKFKTLNFKIPMVSYKFWLHKYYTPHHMSTSFLQIFSSAYLDKWHLFDLNLEVQNYNTMCYAYSGSIHLTLNIARSSRWENKVLNWAVMIWIRSEGVVMPPHVSIGILPSLVWLKYWKSR